MKKIRVTLPSNKLVEFCSREDYGRYLLAEYVDCNDPCIKFSNELVDCSLKESSELILKVSEKDLKIIESFINIWNLQAEERALLKNLDENMKQLKKLKKKLEEVSK